MDFFRYELIVEHVGLDMKNDNSLFMNTI